MQLPALRSSGIAAESGVVALHGVCRGEDLTSATEGEEMRRTLLQSGS